ncbi:unnamed protein product [Ilex paraguariensis]|uniref:Uncharacterized protein n=1 Tax=Ilex paraguariensis TaxID=185542 RepID=A0ABC8RP79_9AQUA
MGSCNFGSGDAYLSSKYLGGADPTSKPLGDIGGGLGAMGDAGGGSGKPGNIGKCADKLSGIFGVLGYFLGIDLILAFAGVGCRHESGSRVCGLDGGGDSNGNLRLGGSLHDRMGAGRVDPFMGEIDFDFEALFREVDGLDYGGGRGA